MTQPPIPAESIGYAMAAPNYGSRVFAASMISFSGLVLIVIGGCFTVGIFAQLQQTNVIGGSWVIKTWLFRDYVFHAVLYFIALICFTSGGLLVWRGVAALTKIAWGGNKT